MVFIGRFQPPVSHHAKVYQYLEHKFPEFDVYFATSNKIDGLRSPFTFEEKQLIAGELGIPEDRVLFSAQLFKKEDYDQYFNDRTTMLFLVSGQKDSLKMSLNNIDQETGLNMTKREPRRPTYFQKANTYRDNPKPMKERGYITFIPNIEDEHGIAEGSRFKKAIADSTDIEHAKKIYVKEYGKYNEEVFNLIYERIKEQSEAIKQVDEGLIRLRKLAGLEPLFEAGPPIQINVDGEADPGSVVFRKPNKSKSYTIASHFDKNNINDESAREEVFSHAMSYYPLDLLNEIMGRLDLKDKNTLAVHDKLSAIVNTLRDNEKSLAFRGNDEEGADWSGVKEHSIDFATKVVSAAARNMELELSDNDGEKMKNNDEDFQKDDKFNAFDKGDEEMEDKLDLSSVREQFELFMDSDLDYRQLVENEEEKTNAFTHYRNDFDYMGDPTTVEFLGSDTPIGYRSIFLDISLFADINDIKVKRELYGELLERYPSLLVREIMDRISIKQDKNAEQIHDELWSIMIKLRDGHDDMDDDLELVEQQLVINMANEALKRLDVSFSKKGRLKGNVTNIPGQVSRWLENRERKEGVIDDNHDAGFVHGMDSHSREDLESLGILAPSSGEQW